MAQILPSVSLLGSDSTAAPSAEDIQNRLPSICVDYLSHDWAEEDVWASWRSMTRHKNEIANGVRLENASWRTWWKQRNKLKTISPETLNWLKDSDVTWLYGPLHTAVEPVPPPKVATADDRLGLSRHESIKKPILKHRTLSEMLAIPGGSSSPVLEAVHTGADADVDAATGEASAAERPPLVQTKSDTNIVRRSGATGSPPRGSIDAGASVNLNTVNVPTRAMSGSSETTSATAAGAVSPSSELASDHASTSGGKRHISFNTFVEQCIAVDDPEDVRAIEQSEGMIPDDGDDDDDYDSEDVLEMRSSVSSSSSRSRPSMSRQSSTTSSDHVTIAKIAPTTLKALGNFPSPSPAVVFAPPEAYALEHGESNGVGYKHRPSYDFPSPPGGVASSQWEDEEEDYSFDYFSGPDLGVGDEYAGSKRGNAPASGSRSSSESSSRDSTARPSPAQTPSSSFPESSSQSGGGAQQQVTTSAPVFIPSSSAPAAPGRSILKIRPPGYAGSTKEPDADSPTSSYFNFNPSVATGIGGFGQGVQRVMREPVTGSLPLYDVASPDQYMQANVVGSAPATPHSAPTSPNAAVSFAAGEAERGRSFARTPANAERSASRGNSLGSGSISPNAARSPVQIPTKASQSPSRMDVDSPEGPYIPQRSNTPTPHSSPQVRASPPTLV